VERGVKVAVGVLVDVAVGVLVDVAVWVGVLVGVSVGVGVTVADSGLYSSAPMSATLMPSPSPSMGLGSPSKSVDGASSVDAASISADSVSR